MTEKCALFPAIALNGLGDQTKVSAMPRLVALVLAAVVVLALVALMIYSHP
jgi:hypothetical protein